MLHLGVDPDLTTLALAIYDDESNSVPWVGVLSARGYTSMLRAIPEHLPEMLSLQLTGPAVAAVEGQQIYRAGRESKGARGADKNDLIHLAHITGMVAGVVSPYAPAVTIPTPFDWKGQRPKLATGIGVCKHLGWDYKEAGGRSPYAVPASLDGINWGLRRTDIQAPNVNMHGSAWKHLMDAVGIALWSAKTRGGRSFVANR